MKVEIKDLKNHIGDFADEINRSSFYYDNDYPGAIHRSVQIINDIIKNGLDVSYPITFKHSIKTSYIELCEIYKMISLEYNNSSLKWTLEK